MPARNNTPYASQQFRLILDELGEKPAACTKDARKHEKITLDDIPALPVPAGMSYLYVEPGKTPVILDAAPDASEGVFVLEPIQQDHAQRLLIKSPSVDRPWINAAVAPRLGVLREGDQLAIGDEGRLLHVTLFIKPFIGKPTQQMLDDKAACCVCGLELIADSYVYACCHCQAIAHVEDDEHRPSKERKPLRCAEGTTTCSNCGRPIVANEGLTYIPQEVLGG